MKIHVLIEPQQATEKWPFPEFMESVRTADEVDRFATELEEQIGQNVSIIEGNLLQAPEDGFIFYYPFYDLHEELNSMSGSECAGIAKRLLVLRLDRGNAFVLLNTFNFLGGVEVYDYFLWLTKNPNKKSRIYARSEIVKNLPLSGEFQEGDFGLITSSESLSLPELLVSYLHLISET